MSFFGDFFHTQQTESVALIDIGAASVAGAYVQYAPDTQPVLLYTCRLPIEMRTGESQERAMLRALEVLGAVLIREGASVLLRATGSGSIDTVLVSVDAPWQKTSIRTEYFERKTPFTFSKKLVSTALEKTSAAAPGELLVDESVIGTILNGYETRDPYGKEVHRASIVILTSRIDERAADGITSLLRSLYHTKQILSIAGSSLRYQAMRIAFPHEREALILDATGPLTALALVRRDLLVDVVDVKNHTNGTHAWLKEVLDELAELAEKFPLPRTIFLLAPASEIESLRKMLDTANLGKLWLSDNPPKIVSVVGSYLTSFVRQTTTTSPDLSLLLMALYFGHRNSEE